MDVLSKSTTAIGSFWGNPLYIINMRTTKEMSAAKITPQIYILEEATRMHSRLNTTQKPFFLVIYSELYSSLIIKDTIKAGSTLRLMSLKHFGHKSFWPYIYEENKEVIKNPNNVPLGTELIIPPADKYDIDAKNKESIQKAKEKESSLIREFNL